MQEIKCICLITFSLYAGILSAQDTDAWAKKYASQSRWMAGLYLDWGVASDRFARNLDRDHGFGLGGELLFNVQKDKPFWAGLGVHNFAFDRYAFNYSQEIDGQFYNYRDKTVSRVFMLQGLARFQPELRFFLQPYVQGAMGVNWFYTNTKVRDTDYDEQVDRVNENRESIWGFSLQAGVHIVPPELSDVRWDLRFGYYRNASIEYLRYNPNISGNFPVDSFEAKKSPVDLFGIHFGLTVIIRPVTEWLDPHD